VFTAHPTEATRRTILVKEQDVAEVLATALRDGIDAGHARELRARAHREVTILWQTEEQLSVRPSVADEVEQTAFYVTEILYPIIGRFYAQLDAAFSQVYAEPLALDPHRPLIRFGSWVGGDMDGNPNVGPDTIRHTLARHAELAFDLHARTIRALFRTLSQSRSRVAVSSEVDARIVEYGQMLPDVRERIPQRYVAMPYRVLLWLMSARLERARDRQQLGYTTPGELVADLGLIATSLARNRGEHAGRELVLAAQMRVATFGFHLMTLDTRQDALVHRHALANLLDDPDFADRSADERTEKLAAALRTPPATRAVDAETERCLAVFEVLGEARNHYGPVATGLSIISMAQGPDDALAVLVLARHAGLVDGDHVPLDIAPLFETVADLETAAATMTTLLQTPDYRAHLRKRGDVQHVMLGYSDSNKDSGITASRWALHRAQVELTEVATAEGVEICFFHGRGGTISRGGSKPRRAILAAPEQVGGNRLRVTEQGEMIRAKYGLPDIAERTLELIVGAMVTRSLPSEPIDSDWTELASDLAAASRTAYRELVREHPDFYAYFRAATPIDVIERMQIGSRPASRRQQRGVEDLRAIPWVFAWPQSRHLLPGWFGVGAGLRACVERHGVATLRRAKAWPFFTNLLGDVEMVLAKADMAIARRYAQLAGDVGSAIFPKVLAAYDETRALLAQILETDDLLASEPVLRRSIALRNPYVDPMSFLQVDALARWRATDRTDAELERVLTATVRGIARGLQNTG